MESIHILISIQILSFIVTVYYATKKISTVLEDKADRPWQYTGRENQGRLEGLREHWSEIVEKLKRDNKEFQLRIDHQNQSMQEALAIKSSLEKQVHELKEMQKSDLREIGVLKAENEWLRAKQP